MAERIWKRTRDGAFPNSYSLQSERSRRIVYGNNNSVYRIDFEREGVDSQSRGISGMSVNLKNDSWNGWGDREGLEELSLELEGIENVSGLPARYQGKEIIPKMRQRLESYLNKEIDICGKKIA